MKRLLCLSAAVLVASAGCARAAEPALTTDDQKTIYALGLELSQQLAVFHFTPQEIQILEMGLNDGVQGKTPKAELETYGPKIRELAQARATATAAAEKKKGSDFLAKIAAKDGVKKLADGVLLETITPGTGASPSPTDTVKVNYTGTLIDGKVFDASERHGGPATFRLDKVIKCWGQGVQYMKVGGKAKLYCPSDAAYGDRGAGADIPPGATLVFDVELVDIVKPDATPTGGK
jgi:FKBP-type peptidyl-prolyl cis-trans isomerase FkpA